MKNISIVGIVALIVVSAVVLFMLTRHTTNPPVNEEPVTFPVGSTTNSTSGTTGETTNPITTENKITLTTKTGETIQVENFLRNPASVEDPQNQGYYYLGYHYQFDGSTATNTPPYIIEYIATTGYFNIALSAEPIADSRKKAEQYLMGILGISPQQMCSLDYMVSVPGFVNEYYSGQDLGFSFCSGSVPL